MGRNRFDYLVELESETAVRELAPDFKALAKLEVRGIIVTAQAEASDYDFISRFFAPAAGVDEDPVTGSAHTVLGPYWMDELKSEALRARQVSARDGKLRVRMDGDRVHISGQAVTVVKGTLQY